MDLKIQGRIGVFRRQCPPLKATAWFEIKEALDDYKIKYKENKSSLDPRITLFNGTIIRFRSLDDLRKIRSLNLDMVWVEQAEKQHFLYLQSLKKDTWKASKNIWPVYFNSHS